MFKCALAHFTLNRWKSRVLYYIFRFMWLVSQNIHRLCLYFTSIPTLKIFPYKIFKKIYFISILFLDDLLWHLFTPNIGCLSRRLVARMNERNCVKYYKGKKYFHARCLCYTSNFCLNFLRRKIYYSTRVFLMDNWSSFSESQIFK